MLLRTVICAAVLALAIAPAPLNADPGVVTDARVQLQDSHGVVSIEDALKRYGTVRGFLVAFVYQFASDPPMQGQPYDFHQVRYSVNGGPEQQVGPVDAHAFNCCTAQPGTHYVFKVQGCRSGMFGSDCTAWFERDFDTPPDATPRPRPATAPPAPTAQPTPMPTPRHVGVHLATPTPTPMPPYALNAPSVGLGPATRTECSYLADPAARTDCITNVAAGNVRVTWTWQRTPCNAVQCYDAESFVVGAAGSPTVLDPTRRSAWVRRPGDPEGCIEVRALHNAPPLVASGSACLTPRRLPGRPQ
ncbi:MAG: hypothetical protein JOZ24_12120 [Candidatus Eremiobacteraeota bacterium]|nr:hypothetical protein [Candidatus Eremiobacteraeota bacterium]